MGGYIGAKTGTLVASASDIRGDISATDTTPEITLKNTTETDADGTRSGKITFKGEQSGGEESVLAQIQGSHDGTADDEKGDLIFKTNDGNDGSSPTEAMRINSDQNISIPDNGKVMFGAGDDLQIYHDATNSNISNATGDLTLDLAGDLIIDVDGGDVKFKDDGTEFSQYYKDGNDLAIYSSISDGDIKFQGKDGGSVITPVTIDMSEGGYVGIGLTAPTAPLTVKSPTNAEAIHVVGRSDDIGQMKFFEADGTTHLATLEARNSFVNFGSQASIPLTFMTSGNERMRILNSGYTLFGTTTNTGGTITTAASGLNTANSPLETKSTTTGSGTVYAATFFNGSTASGHILVNGAATTYATSSDYRLKENVTDISDGITRVKQLEPKRFNWIADENNTTMDGFIAHEAQTVVPEAVSGKKDAVEVWVEGEELPDGVSIGDNKLDDDGNTIPTMQGIDQAKIVPLLTAALKEAIAKIETLETKVAALEAE